jgi:radical SAM superfamily enzyme YgiQ (UPF0313 family)
MRYIRSLRKIYGNEIRIVVGGQLIHYAKEAYLNNTDIDVVCEGDAEVILPKLLWQFEHMGEYKTIDRLWSQRVTDGRYAGMSYEGYFGIHERLKMQEESVGIRQVCVQGAGGPGCSWAAGNVRGACNFCALTNITRMNRTPLEDVLRNEAEVIAQTGATRIFDVANQFLPFLSHEENKKWLREYISLRKKYGITTKRYVYLTIGSIGDDEVVRLLQEAGVEEAYIGIDHFDIGALRELNKGVYSPDRLYKSLNHLQKYNINFRAGIVLGAAKETEHTLDVTRQGVGELLQRFPGDTFKALGVFPVEVLPGSRVWGRMRAEAFAKHGDGVERGYDIIKKFEQTGFLTRPEQEQLTRIYIQLHSEVSIEDITLLERELAGKLRAAGKFEYMVKAEHVRGVSDPHVTEFDRFKMTLK